jgi:nucleoprotein TPR
MNVPISGPRRRSGRYAFALFTINQAHRAPFVQSVQGRLIEENRILTVERSHLSDLMGNVQKMHNDLERSGENDRRRLESQMQMLESQTYVSALWCVQLRRLTFFYSQDLRVQLSQERDSVRHISLQKDIELKELQTRLDKSVCLAYP